MPSGEEGGLQRSDKGDGIRDRIRAKEVANMLQLSSNGSDIFYFLTAAEQSDPELVGFWATAARSLSRKEPMALTTS